MRLLPPTPSAPAWRALHLRYEHSRPGHKLACQRSDLENFLTRELFEPLGMVDTQFGLSEKIDSASTLSVWEQDHFREGTWKMSFITGLVPCNWRRGAGLNVKTMDASAACLQTVAELCKDGRSFNRRPYNR